MIERFGPASPPGDPVPSIPLATVLQGVGRPRGRALARWAMTKWPTRTTGLAQFRSAAPGYADALGGRGTSGG